MRISILLLTTAFTGIGILSGPAAATAGAGAGAASGSSSSSSSASGNAAFGTPSASGNAAVSTSPGANNSGATRPNTAQPRTPLLMPTTNAPFDTTGTNTPTDTNQPGTNQPGTNQVNVTNQVFNTNQVFVTNQFFSTNFVSVTNRVGLGTNDQAATEFDRALILQVRQRIFQKDPGISAAWSMVGFAANGGNILVSGQVAQIQDKQSLLVLVRNTPGVVAVVDHVLVTPTMGSAGGSSGTISRFNNPAPDPSLGDSRRFSAPSNRFGQRIFIPPARGTIIATNPSPAGFSTNLSPTGPTSSTGPTNPASTNIIIGTNIVEGTNVIVVPVETNITTP